MIFPICNILILVALNADPVSSLEALTKVTITDLQTMSNLLSQHNFIANYYGLFCISYQRDFDWVISQTQDANEKNIFATLQNIKSNYPSFCNNVSLKSILSLSLHPDSAVRYGICQTSITKINTNGFCDPPIWSDKEIYRLVTVAPKYNNITSGVCGNVINIHKDMQATYTVNYYDVRPKNPVIDQIVIDLMTSPFCNTSQNTTIDDPVSFIKTVMCKTASGQNSKMCKFASDEKNIISLCQGFLKMNGTTNRELVTKAWKPAFGNIASDQFCSISIDAAVGSALSGNPNANVRTSICVEPFICPPVTASCP